MVITSYDIGLFVSSFVIGGLLSYSLGFFFARYFNPDSFSTRKIYALALVLPISWLFYPNNIKSILFSIAGAYVICILHKLKQ